MGFSMKRWDHEKSEDDCTCQPAHDQTQPETRHGVSGSHCEAQRQNLLRSRSYLSSPLNYNVSSTQPSKLWSCLLGGTQGNVTLFDWTAVLQDKHPSIKQKRKTVRRLGSPNWADSETSELVKNADPKFDVELSHAIDHETSKAAQD